MADPDAEALLRRSVAAFNAGRPRRVDLRLVDLAGAHLPAVDLFDAYMSRAVLRGANLRSATLRYADVHDAELTGADLSEANLRRANLHRADLTGAVLAGADLHTANLFEASLTDATFASADLSEADLHGADLRTVDLRGAVLSKANLTGADLRGVDLSGVDLSEANLTDADLADADLTGADFSGTRLVRTSVGGADFSDALVYGVGVWDLRGTPAEQRDLRITPPDKAAVTVDNLKVAQFIYLLLDNPEIRDVIDTIAQKGVLILGRFTAERKAVLDALRTELRVQGYAPMLFDFDKPAARDLTETVMTLAGLSRFVIADLTDPKSIPQELQAIVPNNMLPVVPIIQRDQSPYALFGDLQRRSHWVLDVYRYDDQESLLADLRAGVIDPAERKAREILAEKAIDVGR